MSRPDDPSLSCKQDIGNWEKRFKLLLKEDVQVNKSDIIDGILYITMNKINEDLAQDIIKKFIFENDMHIKSLAITASGHFARVYKCPLDKPIMEEIARIHKDNNHPLWHVCDNALEDIEMFSKQIIS